MSLFRISLCFGWCVWGKRCSVQTKGLRPRSCLAKGPWFAQSALVLPICRLLKLDAGVRCHPQPSHSHRLPPVFLYIWFLQRETRQSLFECSLSSHPILTVEILMCKHMLNSIGLTQPRKPQITAALEMIHSAWAQVVANWCPDKAVSRLAPSLFLFGYGSNLAYMVLLLSPTIVGTSTVFFPCCKCKYTFTHTYYMLTRMYPVLPIKHDLQVTTHDCDTQ